MTPSVMEDRQQPLAKLYEDAPTRAWVTDVARTVGSPDDPLHGSVVLGPDESGVYPFAVHKAVGGDGDGPVPGDILCAALASCLDSTLRVVANRFRVRLDALAVHATAEVDVRGTLCLDASVPVAFQRMTVRVHLQLAEGTAPRMRDRLLQTAEHCCVVYQTLRRAIPVDLQLADHAVGTVNDETPQTVAAER